MIISELYRYPLKGGQAETLHSAHVWNTGFANDRTWLLVDGRGRFVSQRECSDLALLRTLVGPPLEFSFRDLSFQLPSGVERETRMVNVWKDTVAAWDMGDEAARFFSAALGRELRLCAAKDERLVDPNYTESRSIPYYFADGFPFLIISQESLDDLNERLQAKGEAPVPMNRFRPNIVISGWQAYAEDKIQTIRIGDRVRLQLAKPCSRCNVTTIDQVTAAAGREPLHTLAGYRKHGTSKIYFGMNAWVLSGEGAAISIGDSVVLE